MGRRERFELLRCWPTLESEREMLHHYQRYIGQSESVENLFKQARRSRKPSGVLSYNLGRFTAVVAWLRRRGKRRIVGCLCFTEQWEQAKNLPHLEASLVMSRPRVQAYVEALHRLEVARHKRRARNLGITVDDHYVSQMYRWNWHPTLPAVVLTSEYWGCFCTPYGNRSVYVRHAEAQEFLARFKTEQDIVLWMLSENR